jgi:hypothetical protein
MSIPSSGGVDGNGNVPGSMGPATATPRQPSRSDIAQAVASRMQSTQNEVPSGEEVERQSKHKAKLRKLINETTASVNYQKASACLRVSGRLLGKESFSQVAHSYSCLLRAPS